MLRVKCSACGKSVRGGDDWSGRSGNCPKCNAVIFFPHLDSEFDRAQIAGEEASRNFATRVKQAVEFSNLGKFRIVTLVAATGVSLWLWCGWIVLLAYGRHAYSKFGLRVIALSKTNGILLNNGEKLNPFWNSIFLAGYLGLLYLLMEGADDLVGRIERKTLAFFLIASAGVAAWCNLLVYPIIHPPNRSYFRFHDSSAWHYIVALFAIALVAGLSYRRLQRRQELGEPNSTGNIEK